MENTTSTPTREPSERPLELVGQLATMELRPGDTLLFKTPRAVSAEQAERIRNVILLHVPGHRVLVLGDDADLNILRPAATPAPTPAPPPPPYSLARLMQAAHDQLAYRIDECAAFHARAIDRNSGVIRGNRRERRTGYSERQVLTRWTSAHAKDFRMRGGAIAQCLGLLFVLAFTLGVFGPNLDRLAFSNAPPAPVDHPGEIARFEAEARQKCNALPTDNHGWIQMPDGAIICTDKRGRYHRPTTRSAAL